MATGSCMFGQVNISVYILVILFGIASWIDVNGLWVELPILVQHLPEKWNLPSYMVIIIQVANIGPLAFTLSRIKFPKHVKEVPVIYLIIATGAVSCLLLAFFWDSKTVVAGAMHSTALLTLNFFLALVDCTSSVVFLPFMAVFKPEYITAFFIGEGFSGLLPSLVALVQGASQIKCVNTTQYKNETINGTWVNETEYVVFPKYQEPNFSIETFFFFLCAMMVVCGMSFTALNFSQFCKREQVRQNHDQDSTDSATQTTDFLYSHELDETPQAVDDKFLDAAEGANSTTQLLASKRPPRISIQKENPVVTVTQNVRLCSSAYAVLLGLTCWINALTNGALPSIQSYSVLPYGNSQYHLVVNLSSIANPLACFMAFFLTTSSIPLMIILTVTGTGVGGYCILLAALSPAPYLVGNLIGDILVIAAWFIVTFLLTYTKVSIAALLRIEGKKALLWCGVVTQVGSAIGALIMFLLVNILKVFQQGSPCH